MKVGILGCSGGIGGALRTTSMLVDDDILIDAGTGVADLALDRMAAIDHIFLTHAHLDHIAMLPLLMDSTGGARGHALTVHATEATLRILRDHIFNWRVWPDFTRIPDPQRPYLRFEPILLNVPVWVGGRVVTAVPASHKVPAVGYLLDGGRGTLLFSGDSTWDADFWRIAGATPDLAALIVECAFPERDHRIASASHHYHPSLLGGVLAGQPWRAPIYLTHAKPGEVDTILAEVQGFAPGWDVRRLEVGKVFDL